MLYITTRNQKEIVTPIHPLQEVRGAEGGLYLPFRGPDLAEKQWRELSFNACIAGVLNEFFRTRLTPWDVDCAIGRNPVRVMALGHRILVAELWHNPAGEYRFLEDQLLLCLKAGDGWPRIAVRVAVLTALGGLLQRQGMDATDVCTLTGNFLWPISARYARSWGVKLGCVICTCNENQSLWELLCHGQVRTDTLAISTQVPEADVAIPAELERLAYETGGPAEVEQFLEARARGGIYAPRRNTLEQMRQGMTAQVVSAGRVQTTIPSVIRTNGYRMSPATALAYGGLLDYRAKTGSIGPALVLAEREGAPEERKI